MTRLTSTPRLAQVKKSTSSRLFSPRQIPRAAPSYGLRRYGPGDLPQPGDAFRISGFYIVDRIPLDEADGGGQQLIIGLPKDQIRRTGVRRFVIYRKADDPTIEIHQHLDITAESGVIEQWSTGPAVIVTGTAIIVPFAPDYTTRVDGVRLPVCRKLQDQFGPDYPGRIAADPTLLEAFKWTPDKRRFVVGACRRENKSANSQLKDEALLVSQLCACGVPKGKARTLVTDHDPAIGPTHFFLNGATYLQVTRVASLIDPIQAAKDKPMVVVIAAFLNSQHIVRSHRELASEIWDDYGIDEDDVDDAIDRLTQFKIIREIEKTGLAPANVHVGERVISKYFGRGVIVSTEVAINIGPKGSSLVEFDDRRRIICPGFLFIEKPVAWAGLADLIEHEEIIARILLDK